MLPPSLPTAKPGPNKKPGGNRGSGGERGKSAKTERSTKPRPSPLHGASSRFFNDELWPVVGFVLVAGLSLAYICSARERWECQMDSQRQRASADVAARAVLELAGLRREGFRECNAGMSKDAATMWTR
jgi:hypothetical protein